MPASHPNIHKHLLREEIPNQSNGLALSSSASVSTEEATGLARLARSAIHCSSDIGLSEMM